jgi:hypothetical protein
VKRRGDFVYPLEFLSSRLVAVQHVTEFVRSVFHVISIDLSRFDPFGRLVLVSRIGPKPRDVDAGVGSEFLAVAQGNPQRGTDLPMNLVGSVTPYAPRSGGQRTARPTQARNAEFFDS